MIPVIGADFPKKIIPLLDGATRNIDLITYDWRWYANQPGHPVQQFNIALVRAVKRGVHVRALVNKADLLPTLKSVGINARVTKDARTLHAKLLTIDSKTLVIGSHNITRNAFSHNIEASVVVEIPRGETRFHEFFSNLYGL
jgi:phosphatidylserine/phosphatidylglycerophosphate/cardiolipin synthase-like enzyme